VRVHVPGFTCVTWLTMTCVTSHLGTVTLVLSLVVLTAVRETGAEKFFQYRDHRDQLMYEKDRHTLSVHNKMEAEVRLLVTRMSVCLYVCVCMCGWVGARKGWGLFCICLSV